MVDINGLKKINDEKGHQVGDQVIRQVVESIEQTLPVTMKLYRIGGDEYIISVLKYFCIFYVSFPYSK